MTLPWMAERIQLRAIASLRPHAGNARVHDAAQLAQIMASMQAFGFTNPLLVDEDGVLIAGHGRLAAAEALGIAKVPVIVLKHLAPTQKEALRLADNRIAENATWDQALLRDALASVQAAEIDLAALGFSADELAGILAAAGDAVSIRLLTVPTSAQNPIGLSLQVLECDHLDTARNGVVNGAPTQCSAHGAARLRQCAGAEHAPQQRCA